MKCYIFITFCLIFWVGQILSAPVPKNSLDYQYEVEEKRRLDITDKGYNPFVNKQKLQTILRRRELLAAPQTIEISYASLVKRAFNTADDAAAANADEKPKLLKTVAQGLSKFFQAMKNWYRSGDKVESFKDLGRRFSSWFGKMRERLMGFRNVPIESQLASPAEKIQLVNNVEPVKPVVDAAAVEPVPMTSNELVRSPKVSTPKEPVKPVEPVQAANPVKPVKPAKPMSANELVSSLKSIKSNEAVKPVNPVSKSSKAVSPVQAVSLAPAVNNEASEADMSVSLPKSTPQDIILGITPEQAIPKDNAPKPALPHKYAHSAPVPKPVHRPVLRKAIPNRRRPVVAPVSPAPEVAATEANAPDSAIIVHTPKVPVSEPVAPQPADSATSEAVTKVDAPVDQVEIAAPAVSEAVSRVDAPVDRVAIAAPAVSEAVSEVDAPVDQVAIAAPAVSAEVKWPYQSADEMARINEDSLRVAKTKADAEALFMSLDSEYEGLFEEGALDDGKTLDRLTAEDYKRLKELGANYLKPMTDEDGPVRGRVGTFSHKAQQELDNMTAQGYVFTHVPTWKSGLRKLPHELDPIDALFLDQGVDPLQVDPKDRRNYAIILEWYKQCKAIQDPKHPQHKELYFPDPNPKPEADGRRPLWGSPAYEEQNSRPAPIPYLREEMRRADVFQKISEFQKFGLISADPNRPSFWYHKWLPGWGRTHELEDWITLNIPQDWLDENFPIIPTPKTAAKFTADYTPARRAELLKQYNEKFMEAAKRQNLVEAKDLYRAAQQQATWAALARGASQAEASDRVPKPEKIAADKELWNRMKQKVFKDQMRFNILAYSKFWHDFDERRLKERLQKQGVVVWSR